MLAQALRGQAADRGAWATLRARSARWVERHVVLLAIASAPLLTLGDYVTGVDLTFTLLYAVPIAAVAWWRGRARAFFVAALCVAGAVTAEVASRLAHGWPLHAGKVAWNHGGSLLLFALGVHMLVRLRAYVDKEARERLATVDQLRQAERLGVVGRLASGLAHELGTPLSVIMGHAELITEGAPERHRASAEAILTQARRITAIVRGLLDFSRRSDGKRTAVDLVSLARDARALLAPIARKRGVALEILGDERPVFVHGNPTELEQVLVNLVVNGVHATRGGGTVRVRVRPSPEDGEPMSSPCIEVEDEGEGIAPENLPRIFDPFFTTKAVGEGTGLGLAVSYGIVTDHGGRIRVTSALGLGSRFSVYLPSERGAS